MRRHFFDVGANIGQTFDDYLLGTNCYDGWDIWCFEPSPRHVPALMERVHALSDRYKIHVCPFGLSDHTGASVFFQKDDPRGDSFEHYLRSDHDTVNLEHGYVLHSYCAEIAPFILSHTAPEDRIVLKLDCEGSEYCILRSLYSDELARGQIEEILVEWHTINNPPEVPSFEAIGVTVKPWIH
jgi:FkbM family methyltransferase